MTNSLNRDIETVEYLQNTKEIGNICNNTLEEETKNLIIHAIKEEIIEKVKDISITELELMSTSILEYACLVAKKVNEKDISYYFLHKNNYFYGSISEEQQKKISSSTNLEFYMIISKKYAKLVKKILLDRSKSMKTTGYRKLDSLGRATIPIEYREKYDFEEGCKIDFYPTKDGLLLKRVYSQCIFCGSKKSLVEYRGKKVCTACRKDLEG